MVASGGLGTRRFPLRQGRRPDPRDAPELMHYRSAANIASQLNRLCYASHERTLIRYRGLEQLRNLRIVDRRQSRQRQCTERETEIAQRYIVKPWEKQQIQNNAPEP